MNKQLIGKGIKCLSVEHGQAIKKYFEDNNVWLNRTKFNQIGFIYGTDSFEHAHSYSDVNFKGELIDLPKQYWNPEKELTFPREMEVSDHGAFSDNLYEKKEVICDLGKDIEFRFLTVSSESCGCYIGFKYAREIEEKEKHLFITEDGIKVFQSEKTKSYCVSEKTSIKDLNSNYNFWNGYDAKFHHFYDKQNAIEYIKKRDWKEGELYFVRDDLQHEWFIQNSGKDYGYFRTTKGAFFKWSFFQKCPEGFELPKE